MEGPATGKNAHAVYKEIIRCNFHRMPFLLFFDKFCKFSKRMFDRVRPSLQICNILRGNATSLQICNNLCDSVRPLPGPA